MNRPTPSEYYDYHDCERYLAEKLSIRFPSSFWDYLIDQFDISNGSIFTFLWTDDLDQNPHKEIINAFIDEFGAEAEYRTSW